MKSPRRLGLLTLVLPVVLLIAGVAAADVNWDVDGHFLVKQSDLIQVGSSYTESINVEFDAHSGGGLSLGTTHGSVKVKTWAREKILLIITRTASATNYSDAKSLMSAFLVHSKQEGKNLRLRGQARSAECKKSVGVTFTVWVPQSYNVDIVTENGSIDIGKLGGKFSAHTNDGVITVECDPDSGLDIEVEDRTSGNGPDGPVAPERDESVDQNTANPKKDGQATGTGTN